MGFQVRLVTRDIFNYDCISLQIILKSKNLDIICKSEILIYSFNKLDKGISNFK